MVNRQNADDYNSRGSEEDLAGVGSGEFHFIFQHDTRSLCLMLLLIIRLPSTSTGVIWPYDKVQMTAVQQQCVK